MLRSQIVIVLLEELPAAATKNGRLGRFPERSEISMKDFVVAERGVHSSLGIRRPCRSMPCCRILHGSGRVRIMRVVLHGVVAASGPGGTAGKHRL